jgi:fibrillarin-like pre-rRNA processing protein
LEEIFKGVFRLDAKLATSNLKPGSRVYDEKLEVVDGVELRIWNPFRSKLSAAILNGLENLPLTSGSKVLYLGAASGTTASHVSDIVGENGFIFCVEFSKHPLEKLIALCERRGNMIPLLADASHPETYAGFLERVDVIYQDVAQKNQAEILKLNSELYLKEGGLAMLVVKAASIDSSKKSDLVISEELTRLKHDFKILEVIDLRPYEKGHSMIVAKKRYTSN